MRVVFAAGGTGGHIFPAVAIADEMRRKNPDSSILFIGAKGRIEEKIIPKNNYDLETIEFSGINRRNMLKNVFFPFRFISALNRSKKILGRFEPDVVVGTGGFVSAPVVYGAVKMNIPTLIQEGNSYPGMATKFLSPRVNKVVINFSETAEHLKIRNNITKISYPVRTSLARVNKDEALRFFGLPEGSQTVFVFGGSQGAAGINSALRDIIGILYDEGLSIIWQTGKESFSDTAKLAEKYKDRIKVYEFIYEMNYAYSAADLVVCRAGISSIMELAMLGIPAILVPYPFSSENHQESNARALDEKNAAVMILEKDLKVDLFDKISELAGNEHELSLLSGNIKKFSDPDAAEKILNEILKIQNK